ncbi:MAG: hypothetical protein HOL01_21975 [Planctomycetaceae bacterium]|nr:hypothetical protein [Planctomycetaceae bacterium]MBT6485410.1 hypothetical protein [Planctomycetaceae bacterium]MBT6497206.1 hypothetical protein [Planctomycetaceae bacterium]
MLQLHAAGQHEHVIAAIEAALIHGQAQPWMYETLALSMQITGRPKDEVERVLLSRVDFTAADVDSMLYSAAYLTRFGGETLALRLYRQASRLAPTRHEPYVMGLKLALKQKDYDTVGWAAAGIITSAWTGNHKQLHREAEDAALEAEQKLRQAGKTEQADKLKTAMAAARVRDLVVRLTWAGVGDLDVVVEEPPGTICSFDNPQSRGGGVLMHDGYGPTQDNCYEEYACPRGVPGNYRLRIKHVWGNIVGRRAQLVVIRYQGTERETVRKYPIVFDRREKVIRLALKQGRRTELAPARRRDNGAKLSQRVPRRRSLLQMTGRLNPDSRLAGQRFGASRQQLGRAGNVGFRPVISVLSEGVTNNAMAVVSGDRRYVRITTTPAFTALTDVFTFSFVNNGGNPTGNPGVGGNGGNGN